MTTAYEIKAEVSVWLTDTDIEDIMVTALEGGIGYWSVLDNTGPEFEEAPEDEPVAITATKILLSGGELVFYDVEDKDEKYVLTLSKLLNGVKLFIEQGHDRYGAFNQHEIDMCHFDSDCADTLVQLALFGEIVFG